MRERLERIVDFVTDPRVPHNMLATKLRAHKFSRLRNASPSRSRLLVAMTFDVEREYGSTIPSVKRPTERLFLEHVDEYFRVGTIFIEGSLVGMNSDRLRSLQEEGFEIGLHGYKHELWGGAQWYLRDRPLSAKEKDSLVKTALDAFGKAGLDKPNAFRAPNLVIDGSTREILRRNGFTIDSSLPSHRGSLPIPILDHEPNGLVGIPVTADPVPDLRRLVIPYLRYKVFNLKVLKELSREDISRSLNRIIAIQVERGFPCHIVINAHSWEFYEPTMTEFSYCSEGNFEFLHNLMGLLAENFGLEYVTMSMLARILLENKT
jgi:peptidoglycan/xylan/chitin deacetylase (PgdA/CDA1 family)